MDLIDFVRLAFFVFFALSWVVLAMYPTQEDMEDYEHWLDYFDKAYRENRHGPHWPPRAED